MRESGRAIATLTGGGLLGAISLACAPNASGAGGGLSPERYCAARLQLRQRDEALRYGYGICDGVAKQRSYAEIINGIKADFATPDEYQASYLTSQAVKRFDPP